jgi:phosphopantetheinyl transferase
VSPGGLLEVWILPVAEAHAGLRRVLGCAEVHRSPGAKPWAEGGPHFNLSHSGELALIAVCADAPVGVDLEADRRLRNPPGLARRICTDRELAAVTASPDLNAALLRLWVRKEAVAKAEGGGLSTALSGIDVLDPLVDARGTSWCVHDLAPPGPGYVAAVAWHVGR